MHCLLHLLNQSGVRRGANHWVPNLVNMADGLTPPNFKSWISLTVWTGRMRLAIVMPQTRKNTTHPFFLNHWLTLILKHVIVILKNFVQFLWFSFEWPLYFLVSYYVCHSMPCNITFSACAVKQLLDCLQHFIHCDTTGETSTPSLCIEHFISN
jgi:hypothetical protein